FNDLPDRLADLLVLIGAGYSIHGPVWAHDVGWAAGALALITAYVRVLGGSAGVPQSFIGPMAKQHRMAVITAACLLTAIEEMLGSTGRTMTLALAIVAVGCVITIARRVSRILRVLESR